MINRILNALLVLCFGICYTEWGDGLSTTIFRMEYELLFVKRNLLETITHPLIASGLAGQLGLIYCAIVPRVPKWLNLGAILLLAVIVLLFLLVGILSANYKIIGSALPFILIAGFQTYSLWKQGKGQPA